MVDKLMQKDVLVVGGGVAGLTAAIETSALGVDVLLVSKGLIGKSGASCLASSLSYAFPFEPPDNVESALKDFVIGENYYLIDQEIAKAVLTESQNIGRSLERIGIIWRRNPDGSLYQDRRKSIKKGMVYSTMRGETGKSILDALRDEALRRKVEFLEETAVTSLLTKDGKVVGATALDYLNGNFVAISAKSVILATGPGGNFWTYCTEPREQTGDGLAVAYRAGADLIGIEMNRWWLSGMRWPKCWAKISAVLSANFPTQDTTSISPKLYDSKGRILELQGTEAARVMALFKKTGTLHESLFCSYKEANKGKLENYWYYFRYLKKLGIDLSEDLIACQPIPHTMCGGVRVNIRTETNLPGLYCAGGIAGIYISGPGLVNCLCLGRWSAKYAWMRAREIRQPSLDWRQIEKEEMRVFDFLKGKLHLTLTPAQIKKSIREIMWKRMHFVKNEHEMKAGLNELHDIRRKMLPKMQLATDTKRHNTGWLEALEVINMLEVCELIIKASLFRKESRGTFQREDYPEIENEHWLKNIIVRFERGKPKITALPVKLTYFRLEDDHRSSEEKSRNIPCVWKE